MSDQYVEEAINKIKRDFVLLRKGALYYFLGGFIAICAAILGLSWYTATEVIRGEIGKAGLENIMRLSDEAETIVARMRAEDRRYIIDSGTYPCMDIVRVVGPDSWDVACEFSHIFHDGSLPHSDYDVFAFISHLDFPKNGHTPIYQLGTSQKDRDGFTFTVYTAYDQVNHLTITWIAVSK